jgi:hypothetical protein
MGNNGNLNSYPALRDLFASLKRYPLNKKYKQPPSPLPTLAAIFG